MTDKDLGAAAGGIFAKAFTLGYETGRKSALFPATEPAEDSVGDPLQAWKEFLKPKPIGWYRTMTPQFATEHFGFPGVIGSKGFWTHTASDGGKWAWDGDDWELREYPPAPAEPAEDETKAGPWTVQLPEGMTMEQWIESLPDEAPGLLAAVREVRERLGISSPVVPAPTETGPKGTAAELREFAENLIADIENRELWTASQIAEHIEENFQ